MRPTYRQLLEKIASLEQDNLTLRQLQSKVLQQEERLSESDEKYWAIFDKAAVGIVHCDLEGCFLKANEQFVSFIGYSEDELLSMSFRSVTYPDELQMDLDGLKDLVEGKLTRFSRDKRYIRKDGKVIWGHVEVSLMHDTSGRPSFYLTFINDITERKAAEKTLASSEKHYRTIFENSPLGMVRIDKTGIICDCNKKLIDMLGSSREKIIGFHTERLTNPQVYEAICKAISGEATALEGSYVSVTGGKTTSFARAIFKPVNPGQAPTDIIGTVEDISDRKFAEEAIKQRILSLTRPLDDASGINFEDLFNIEDIQLLQDQFAKATGVSSIITKTDGTPITRPSNFSRLCGDIVRKSEKGLKNCYSSDALLGQLAVSSPVIRTCTTSGLRQAGAGISVGGCHVANWLIGQIRDAGKSDEAIRFYAREIELDEDIYLDAYKEIPTMPKHHFEVIAQALFTLANRLSTTAYQNVQQARFITEIRQAQEKLQESENRLRFALEGASDGIWDVNMPTREIFLSPRAREILGYSSDEKGGIVHIWRDLIHPDDRESTWQRLDDHLSGRSPIFTVEHRLKMRSGEWKWVLTRGKAVDRSDGDQVVHMTGTYTDITERKQIEQTQMFLLECGMTGNEEDFFRSLARFLSEILEMDYVCIDILESDKTTAQTIAVYHDGRYLDNISYTLKDTPCGDVVDQTVCCYPEGVCDLFPEAAILREIEAEGYMGITLWNSQAEAIGLISIIRRRPLVATYPAEAILKLVGIRAATELERRGTEKEKAQLQSQLIQAQKMESVGRLAGGVAHDFNNMLGVILGHTELAQDQIAPTDLLFDDLQEIKKAAQRSVNLTRQLLAFARKQTVSPKILDLNATVDGLLKMLFRLIGEDIDLIWLPGEDLWSVRVDPTQVDQILANLAVNARDAIEGVGRITIETNNAVFNDEYCANHMGAVAGDYVRLSVSDSGCGMDRQTQEHIFEPFFTTKEVGQGTGLGLATIYGIVKQNGGFVNVYSEIGHGTTCKIYLPRYSTADPANRQPEKDDLVQKGQETVLMVEDEPSILAMGKRMLASLGYTVLTAATPSEVFELMDKEGVRPQLLVTDVIMPQMNGRELATRLLSRFPELKCLFMSGYTADTIAHHGVLDEGVNFIQKPFSKKELARKIRMALDQE